MNNIEMTSFVVTGLSVSALSLTILLAEPEPGLTSVCLVVPEKYVSVAPKEPQQKLHCAARGKDASSATTLGKTSSTTVPPGSRRRVET